jgi:hypothetical protein
MSVDEPAAAALRAWRRAGGALRVVVSGGSMAPLLLPGDVIVVAACPPERLRHGAVVVVEAQGGLLTHRLVRAAGAALLLWGDALPAPDPPVPAGALVGVAAARERGGRRLELAGFPWGSLGRAIVRPRTRRLARLALRVAAAPTRGDSRRD